nr:hypothetical protein CTI12_AA145160 [Tanacetum cinerariifolium]
GNVHDPLTSKAFPRSFWGFDGLVVVDELFRVYWVNGFSCDVGFCLWVRFETSNHRTNGDSSSFGDSVNKEGNGSRHSNDIKVDIPEYDGKLDLDEFVEWLRTVELVLATEDNK